MRVSVKELLRNFSLLSDKALTEPVIITKNGRDRLVLIGFDEYAMLRDMIDRPATATGDSAEPAPDATPPAARGPKRA